MNPRTAFEMLFERDPPDPRPPVADHQVRAALVLQAHESRHPARGDAGTDPEPGRR